LLGLAGEAAAQPKRIPGAIGLPDQSPPEPPRLTGLSNVGGRRLAVVQIHEHGRFFRTQVIPLHSRAGEVELLSLDEAAGLATIRVNKPVLLLRDETGKNADKKLEVMDYVLRLEEPAAFSGAVSSKDGTLWLNQTRLSDVLELYQQAKQRSVLAPATVLNEKLTLRRHDLAPEQAARLFEDALAERGIAAIEQGEKFVVLAQKGWAQLSLDRIKSIPAGSATVDEGGRDKNPPVSVHFQNAPPESVYPFYGQLAGKPVRSSAPHVMVTFRSHALLSRNEVRHALDCVLALNGVEMRHGEEFIEAVQLRR
jgi:hypothetical protein